MEILDYLDLPTLEPKYVAQAVQDYIAARKDMISSLDVTVRVSIYKLSETGRASKAECVKTLAQLVSSTGEGVWSNKMYTFDFGRSIYTKGKKALHVSPGEAVALYQKLVRGQDNATWAAFYANMKKKFGPDFLQGAV